MHSVHNDLVLIHLFPGLQYIIGGVTDRTVRVTEKGGKADLAHSAHWVTIIATNGFAAHRPRLTDPAS